MTRNVPYCPGGYEKIMKELNQLKIRERLLEELHHSQEETGG
jgi:hypothetical protein